MHAAAAAIQRHVNILVHFLLAVPGTEGCDLFESLSLASAGTALASSTTSSSWQLPRFRSVADNYPGIRACAPPLSGIHSTFFV